MKPTGLICDSCGSDDAYWAFLHPKGMDERGPKYCLRCINKIVDGCTPQEEGKVPAQEKVTCPQILAAENEGMP